MTGSHDNHRGRMVSRGTPLSRYLQTLATAEMAFSVALIAWMSSLAVSDWMAMVNRGRASTWGGVWLQTHYCVEIRFARKTLREAMAND